MRKVKRYFKPTKVRTLIKVTKTKNYNIDLYVLDILNVITEMPNYYPYADPFEDQVIVSHVDEIINYRESLRNSFTE